MSGASALIVLQARIGSARLPGKVLAPIAGQPMLGHCIRRLQASRMGPVIVATTSGRADDSVADVAWEFGAGIVRGADADVLTRYVQAVAEWEGAFVIRATADNPAVDPESCERLVRRLEEGADYAVEDGLPVGATVEAVRTEVLRAVSAEVTSAEEREHVTLGIRSRPTAWRVVVSPAPDALRRPDLRLTVDTADDLARMRRLLTCADAGRRIVPLADLIWLADRFEPESEVA